MHVKKEKKGHKSSTFLWEFQCISYSKERLARNIVDKNDDIWRCAMIEMSYQEILNLKNTDFQFFCGRFIEGEGYICDFGPMGCGDKDVSFRQVCVGLLKIFSWGIGFPASRKHLQASEFNL